MRLLSRAILALFTLTSLVLAANKTASKPNIIVILIDDQDFHMNSMSYMENLQSQLIQQGTYFTKHYGHVSQCCPARTTLWTGRHAHNTNVTSVINGIAGGAWSQIQKEGLQKKSLFPWMQDTGYDVYYTGKIYNGYGIGTYCKPACLEGFNKAHILADPRTYTYYNSSWIDYDGKNWAEVIRKPGYSTDEVGEHAVSYINESVSAGKPFFVVAAPVACHISGGVTYPNNHTRFPYPVPKDEYKDLYQDLQVPRVPNFNPDNQTGVAAIWGLDKLDAGNVWYLDEDYRMRQRALRSVDDVVLNITKQLNASGVADNTYIFYTSDNGYHLGTHRLQAGKLTCYEEDVNLPFIIKGPDVAKNQTNDLVTGHIDLAPTILELAGADIDPSWELDGSPIIFPLENKADYIRNTEARGEVSHLEFWGPLRQEGMFMNVASDADVNLYIYKALRIQGAGYNLMYSVWCQDSAHELYDMSWDPYQLSNLHPDAPKPHGGLNAYVSGHQDVLGRPTWQVLYRLDAMVLVQKTCVADVCRKPWLQLHPDGSVNSLLDALNEKYDTFYENSYNVAKVGWEQCYKGLSSNSSATLYSLENEKPIWLNMTIQQLVHKGGSGGTKTAFCNKWSWLFAWLGLMSVVGY